MKHTILDPEYEAVFIDHKEHPPSTPFLLRGLAAAIQDSHKSWRPPLSELAAVLQRMPNHRSIVDAGAAYGAAKHMQTYSSGSAILLFGAALNAVGSMPNVELDRHVAEASEILDRLGVLKAPPIMAVLEAARQRAGFDKVGEMMRSEFRAGLISSGRYDNRQIDRLVPEIVKATHATRHHAVTARFAWAETTGGPGVYIAEPSRLTEQDERNSLFFRKPPGDSSIFGTDRLFELVEAAMVGCAFALLPRVEKYRDLPPIVNGS